MYPTLANPDVRVVKVGGKKVEFRWWIDVCPEVDNPGDECPGYILEHLGPAGSLVKQRECPDHGFRWQRSYLSPQEQQEDRRIRTNAARLPERMSHYTFATFPRPDSQELIDCMDYASAGKLTQSLLMQGMYGVGKTGLAVSVLKHRIEHYGERALFMVVPSLLQEIRAGFNVEGPQQNPVIDRVRNVSLLALDDLGAEKPSEWVIEQMYSLLNDRLIRNRPTIITTNLSMRELADRLGERLVERLKHYRILVVNGPNLRDEQ